MGSCTEDKVEETIGCVLLWILRNKQEEEVGKFIVEPPTVESSYDWVQYHVVPVLETTSRANL
jgi:hypothetical protein